MPVVKNVASVDDAYNRGKQEAASFYQEEIKKLRVEISNHQKQVLGEINQKVISTVGELESRLPDLVIGIAERVLGQTTLDGTGIE